MNWQNAGYNLRDATLGVKQDRPVLHGFVSLCRRARLARLWPWFPKNQTPPHASLDDGQEAQIPPLSVETRWPTCPAPTFLGTMNTSVKPVSSMRNPLGGSPQDGEI